jgi:hypothetical protein
MRKLIFAAASMLAAMPALAAENTFVNVPQADSPGNDYAKIEHFSFEECQSACDKDPACGAYTYNQIRGICFLKSAANEWTKFHVGAITGIKLQCAQIRTERPEEF